MIGSFIYLSHFSGSPPVRPTSRPMSRTASSCPGGWCGERAAGFLKDAAWLRDGRLARLLGVLGVTAKRRAWLAARCAMRCSASRSSEFDIATTAVPQVIRRPRRRASSRCRPASSTAPSPRDRQPAVRSHHACEDIETFGRDATVRFCRDWRADAPARLHHERSRSAPTGSS